MLERGEEFLLMMVWSEDRRKAWRYEYTFLQDFCVWDIGIEGRLIVFSDRCSGTL